MNDLLPQHQVLLIASAITQEVAEARGYRSITKKSHLEALGFGKRQRRVPALLIPIHSVHGAIATYQIRSDDPRIDGKRGTPIKYETIAGSRMVLDIPPASRASLCDPKVPLFITEGVRKADAGVSAGLRAIDVLGVWNWRGTNEEGGKTALADWESIALNNRKLYLVFDSDVMEKRAVFAALLRLRAFLESRGARVLVIYLPATPAGAKVGLDDFFAAGGTIEMLLSHATCEVRSPPSQTNQKNVPELDAGEGDLAKISAQALEAIKKANDPPFLFRYGGLPTRIEHDDKGRPFLRQLTQERLRHVLARAASWYREKDGEAMPARPPADVPADLLAMPTLELPILERIVLSPIIAGDGSAILAPGYHEVACVYYHPDGLEVPDLPTTITRDHVVRAREFILKELLGDFPFVGPADRANAVALLQHAFVRDLIDGPTPLHLVEKPSPGTGAGLLVDVIALAATGHPPTLLTEGGSEDEWRKRITAVLREGPQVVSIDNLRRRLDSAALSSVLTTMRWGDRLLGVSDMISLPVNCVWVATANNPAISTEISRRCVSIRLDARTDQPWLRDPDTFRHPNLREWAREHRGELVWAALVLARAWVEAGMPSETSVSLGSYESWSGVMGGILRTAEIPGFLDNAAEFYERTDVEGEEWRLFIGTWWERFHEAPVGVADLWALGDECGASVLPDGKSEQSRRVRFGNEIKKLRDRRFGSLRVIFVDKYQGATRWKLLQVGDRPEPPRESRECPGAGEGVEHHTSDHLPAASGECPESRECPQADGTPAEQGDLLVFQGTSSPDGESRESPPTLLREENASQGQKLHPAPGGEHPLTRTHDTQETHKSPVEPSTGSEEMGTWTA